MTDDRDHGATIATLAVGTALRHHGHARPPARQAHQTTASGLGCPQGARRASGDYAPWRSKQD